MLLSVKEVAAKLGVSDVTIYSKLKLKEFNDKVVKKGNKAMVDEDLFNLIKESLNLTNKLNNDLNDNENKNYESTKDEASNDDLSLVNILVNQLNEKDKQIAQLTQMLSDANAKRDEHAAYISKLLENEQVLRGHKEGIPIKNNTADPETAAGIILNQESIEEVTEDVQEENEQPKKKWWKFWK